MVIKFRRLQARAFVLASFMLYVSAGHAEKFSNQFIEFELPAGWSCKLETAEWVCSSGDPALRKEALIILAAKLKGSQDSIDQYKEYLKAAKIPKVQPRQGHLLSTPKSVNTPLYGNQLWVDGLHLNSELPDYFTRYFVTIKDDLAVLITFSVRSDLYQKYLNAMDGLVQTVRVFRKPGGINVVQGAAGSIFGDAASSPTASVPALDTRLAEDARKSKQSSDGDGLGLVLLVGAGAGVFIWWRRRKKK